MTEPHASNPPDTPAPAYILAGGRSTRFGSDKARATIAGTPMIVRIASRLQQRGHPVTVIAREPDQYADLGLSTIADLIPDQGPLTGLRTALQHRGTEAGPGWLVMCSCDLIDLDPAWLEQLESAQRTHPRAIAIAWRDDRWQPFPGLYHTDLTGPVASATRGSLQQLLDASNAIALPVPPGGLPQANRATDLP
ncbi:MAG: molybdenum cofactor guanylyltransferase [Phycisphaerales bacterium]